MAIVRYRKFITNQENCIPEPSVKRVSYKACELLRRKTKKIHFKEVVELKFQGQSVPRLSEV